MFDTEISGLFKKVSTLETLAKHYPPLSRQFVASHLFHQILCGDSEGKKRGLHVKSGLSEGVPIGSIVLNDPGCHICRQRGHIAQMLVIGTEHSVSSWWQFNVEMLRSVQTRRIEEGKRILVAHGSLHESDNGQGGSIHGKGPGTRVNIKLKHFCMRIHSN